MPNKKNKELLCGDIVNSLACESRYFQWSIMYKWYSELSKEDMLKNKVWTLEIVKFRCIPEEFDFS
jgi:hypothetical protein